MYLEDRSAKSNIVNALKEARSDIVIYGWQDGGSNHENEWNPYGTYPRCPWIAVVRVIERIRAEHPDEETGGTLWGAEAALLAVTHTIDIGDFFCLNDAQPKETGKQWALDTLEAAANFVNGVPVTVSEAEATDTGSTRTPVFGSITNAESPVKRFLRKLRLAK